MADLQQLLGGGRILGQQAWLHPNLATFSPIKKKKKKLCVPVPTLSRRWRISSQK
jgi:hypothetical protein